MLSVIQLIKQSIIQEACQTSEWLGISHHYMQVVLQYIFSFLFLTLKYPFC